MADAALSKERVVIVGGGLTGLAAAHRLNQRAIQTKRPIEIVVLESRDRVGGAIWTERRDGFLLEGGADAFITNKPHGVDVCRELGIENRLIATDAQNRRSFVVREGRLVPIPEGFVMIAPSRLWPLLTSPVLSARGKARVLMDLFVPRRDADGDESLASFVRRRLGREALDRLVQPLVGGIYTADPTELSLSATLPQFAEMERRHRSLILAARRQSRAQKSGDSVSSGARYGLFVTLDGGMSLLPAALAESLPEGSIRLNTAVRRIAPPDSPRGLWRVELLDSRAIESQVVVAATEAHAAARLVDGFDAELARQLRSIPYASSVVVNIAYPRDAIAHPLDGFGAVVPAIEQRRILAVSFSSVKFPGRAPAGTVLLRVFVGGALQPELFELNDEEVISLAREELESLIGARGEPILVDVARHARGMPQYTLGHLERMAAIHERAARHSGLLLAGNAFSGVGIPDCLRQGREAADSAIVALAERVRRAVA